MKKTATLQKNTVINTGMRGMYGSTANALDMNRAYAGTGTFAKARTKIHPSEAGVVSGRRVRVESPEPVRTAVRSLGRLFTLRGILVMLVSALSIAAVLILMLFNFESATVHGNTKYSQEQIESFIKRGYLGENTFVMALKYHHRTVKDIPFVDQIDIDIITPSTVRVNIKEKPTDCCVFYNGKNVYMSSDGMIQTVSGRAVEDTTMINGVVLTHSNTDTRALAKNQLGLNLSLELMRAAQKYGICPDSIDVDEKSSLTVTFDQVKVLVGKTGYDQKMFKMHQILPYMEGRSGTISMIAYTGLEATDSEIVLSPNMSEKEAREAVKAQETASGAAGNTGEAAQEAEAEANKVQNPAAGAAETSGAGALDGAGSEAGEAAKETLPAEGQGQNESTAPAESAAGQEAAEPETPAAGEKVQEGTSPEAETPAAEPAEGTSEGQLQNNSQTSPAEGKGAADRTGEGTGTDGAAAQAQTQSPVVEARRAE